MAKKKYTLYWGMSELVTNQGAAQKNGVAITEGDLGIIQDATLVVDENKTVVWFGTHKSVPREYLKNAKCIDLRGKILTPALSDCHTHLIFDGIRDDEFAQRLNGATYAEIAASGGGIIKSVTATRRASEARLFMLACQRIESILDLGVGIIEIKSGYGLDLATELKCLKVIAKLKRKFAKRIIIKATFLGAHAFPPGTNTVAAQEKYVDEVCRRMIPAVATKKLADACDVFFDKGYFTRAQSSRILQCAKKHGLSVKVHADELTSCGGAELAAELGALSADHLLRASVDGLKAMAKSGTVAVLLPTTAFYLLLPYADVKKMRAAGVCMAIASDFNPGSSPTFHMPFVMSLSCLQMGLTMPEAFAAATYGSARALGLHKQHGHITVGQKPKLAVFDCTSYRCIMGQIAHPGLGTVL